MPLKKFLIVDDDSDDRELFVEALSAMPYDTDYYHATDGYEAIEKLADGSNGIPDIIFLDINMPGMSGWECLTKIKSENGYQNIPVIIYTTSSHLGDRITARQLGADCFVTKMYDFKKLKKLLEIVLAQLDNQSVKGICDSIYKGLSLN